MKIVVFSSQMLKSLSHGKLGVRSFSRGVSVDDLIRKTVSERPDGLLAEHEVWSILGDLGFSISSHKYATPDSNPAEVAMTIKADRLVAKGVVRQRKDNSLVTHKTDIGALQFNIPPTEEGVHQAMKTFQERFNENSPYKLEGILFVEQMKMSNDFGTEMLVSGYQDPFFGPTVCYGFGGTIVEYLNEVMLPGHAQLFMPAMFKDKESYKNALLKLPVANLSEGKVRGTKAHLDHDVLSSTLMNVQDLMTKYSQYTKDSKYIIDELEVNPTVAIQKKMWALDGVMRVSARGASPYISPFTCGKPLEKIDSLMKPKSIIVAGASSTNMRNPGSVILSKAKDCGLKERYALHPKASELLGNPAFPSLKKILDHRNGKPVDLLTVGIPAKGAGKLVSEALDLGAANSIQVISGGFGETEHGAKMQQTLHDKLFGMEYSKRPVMNGPNTVGNIDSAGINTIFVDSARSNSDWKTGKTNCAIICQSGAFAISRISDIAPAVNPSIAISVGNQLDLSVTDFLEFYIDRPDLTTFGLYVEGLSDGEGIRLMNLVRKARDIGKSVVIYKAGRTQAGIRAAKGHTAAMAGDFKMFKNLLELAGALVVDTLDEWNQLVILTTVFPSLIKTAQKKSVGVGVLTNAGFEKCACADHLMSNGTEGILHLPQWSEETLKEITKIFTKNKIDEVVDVSEVLDVTPLFTDTAYYELLRVILKDPECDVGVISGVPETHIMKTLGEEINDPKSILQYTKKLVKEFPNKIIVGVFESGPRYEPLRHALNSIGVATFASIDAASRAITKIIKAANNK